MIGLFGSLMKGLPFVLKMEEEIRNEDNKRNKDDTYIAECCSSKNKADGVTSLLEAVQTMWITHLHAIARYVELKDAVIRLTTASNYADLGLDKFILREPEWSLAEEIMPAYQAFKDCFVSLAKGDAPLVHQTIPIIRTLRERLGAIVNDNTASRIIRHGASNVIKVLEKFYPDNGGSDMYTIAMILHPRFKLEWFRAKGYDQEWIDKAVGTVRGIWEKYYLPNVAPQESDSDSMDIEAYEQPSPAVDPFTQYLSEPTIKTSAPLAYWKALEEARLGEQQLIRMAKDYLSAPGTYSRSARCS
ncbi:hypothetical protein SISNIDRAFT_167273 [Sistotremastrum niveocremeum HHB9708]|uniref:HAT C-terminal dimerisation domain-containing protein n=1 Tax=Sistotremastrum niveocremeum HHB9708 TaxID=1314777 RepID=A0A164S9U3_9AGAM|nr:hypothetical protein SISNIDRAFT_167273 [Sistotremastrum niveocremeum HHB9708]